MSTNEMNERRSKMNTSEMRESSQMNTSEMKESSQMNNSEMKESSQMNSNQSRNAEVNSTSSSQLFTTPQIPTTQQSPSLNQTLQSEKDAVVEYILSRPTFTYPRQFKFSATGEFLQDSEPSKLEQKQRLLELLTRDPALFLEKYGHYLDSFHLDYFESWYPNLSPNQLESSENASAKSLRYEIHWHLKDLRAKLQPKITNPTMKRNRRFAKMQELEREGEYFSEDAMKSRDPKLYFHYVAKYNPRSNLKTFPPEASLVERLLQNADFCDVQNEIDEERKEFVESEKKKQKTDKKEMQREEMRKEDQRKEEKQEEHNVEKMELFGMEATEEHVRKLIKIRLKTEILPKELEELIPKLAKNPMYAMEVAQFLEKYAEEEEEEEEEKTEMVEEEDNQPLEEISEEQKAQEYEEFTTIMKQKFLDGLDKDFDYSTVDDNQKYDDYWQQNQDAEDKYFDFNDEALVD